MMRVAARYYTAILYSAWHVDWGIIPLMSNIRIETVSASHVAQRRGRFYHNGEILHGFSPFQSGIYSDLAHSTVSLKPIQRQSSCRTNWHRNAYPFVATEGLAIFADADHAERIQAVPGTDIDLT